MNIDFTCQKCEGGFELETDELADGSEKLECPHCGAKATQAQTDDFTAALAELVAQIAVLSKKFTLSLSIDAEEVAAPDAKEDDEDEDEDDDDDDDLDEDDDEDDDDEDYDDDAGDDDV